MLGVLRHGDGAASRGDPVGETPATAIPASTRPCCCGLCGSGDTLLGIALDGLGFLLQIAALRLVPIYVVAAAIAASLAVTAIVAAWLMHTRLSAMEWAAVAVVCASLAMLGIAAGPEGDGHGPPGLGWALLVIVAVVFVAGATAGRLGDRYAGPGAGIRGRRRLRRR